MVSGMSPISSRNSVPWFACSNFPMWRAAAPVNEPFSCPKSSDSINSAGTAAQFKVTNGPLRRGLFSCRVRAASSFPVPVSPRMQTRVSLAATRSTCAITRCIASPVQMISCFPSRAFSCWFSCSRRFSLSAFSTVSSSLSVESGFSRKSSAPSRVARTAISMCACPDIITTGAVTPLVFKSSNSASPSRPGMTTSERIRSNSRAFASSSALPALSHTVASCPARRKARASDASVFGSSSTISNCAFISVPGCGLSILGSRFSVAARSIALSTGLPITDNRQPRTTYVITTDLNISLIAALRLGNSIRNVVPFPGVLSTLMLPW